MVQYHQPFLLPFYTPSSILFFFLAVQRPPEIRSVCLETKMRPEKKKEI